MVAPTVDRWYRQRMTSRAGVTREEALRRVLRDAVDGARRSGRVHRHPAQVTADRLKDAHERWYDKFDGRDLDDMGRIIQVLEEIADGER